MKRAIMTLIGTSNSFLLDEGETFDLECAEDEVHTFGCSSLAEVIDMWEHRTIMNGDDIVEVRIEADSIEETF